MFHLLHEVAQICCIMVGWPFKRQVAIPDLKKYVRYGQMIKIANIPMAYLILLSFTKW